jgi:OHCU decarboxylase
LSVTLRELDALSESDAADLLRSCCGSARWIDAMVARRPFRSEEELLSAADDVWSSCTEEDWLEAFAHHPRIGATQATAAQTGQAGQWSAEEQGRVRSAASVVQEDLVEVNRAYEERFGFIYIVCATGKSPEELLSIANRRLSNGRDTELRIAAEEQRRITHIRLQKLLGAES